MSATQRAFLRLHTQPVSSWRWHFLGTQLRATGADGASCTLGRGDVESLVRLGLMAWGVGFSVELTPLGIDALESEEEESQDA